MIELVKEEQEKIISVDDMKDGDVGVIVIMPWSPLTYIDRIVQRHGENLIAIGLPKGSSWPCYFTADRKYHNDCRVRLLEKGEKLVVT